ncbi:type I glyceraldehyde-3-phosphate dehydrogenase [Candidatus Daviesbacteria bacterium]|nr:type I glyceraldehyde-3-phosphate dehydrogenase [Candidatus Daviesbacteria bacterium]
MLKVAINGFGRIGRSAFKVAVEKHSEALEIVAINDLTSPQVLAQLLKYDSAYGVWSKEVSAEEHPSTASATLSTGSLGTGNIVVEGKKYPILKEKEPAKLPWSQYNVDVVIESTGRFTDKAGMEQHLQAGAKVVVLSAPAKGEGVGTYVLGVNQDKYGKETLINNASCTTNCIAPVTAIIQEKFGIIKAVMTTIHSVTAEQNLVDGPPPGGKAKDLRRARSALVNMIPTTTGAAKAVTEAIPELKGLFDGRAIRVPTITGSLSDITYILKKKTTVEEVNGAIKQACEDPRWKGIVAFSEGALVSSDIVGRSESAIVDLPLTQVIDGDLVKIFAWYDNEWGYSNRLIEQVINVGQQALVR